MLNLMKKRKGQSIVEWVGAMVLVGAVVAAFRTGMAQNIANALSQKITNILTNL